MTKSNNGFASAKNIELVYSGEDYFSRLEAIICNSKFEIHLQMYLFDTDATGLRIIKALKAAAARNVAIYILLDGLGSLTFPAAKIQELRDNGINIRFFAPLFSSYTFYLGRRLHRKVVVSDAQIALVGGINIADKYHGTAHESPWLDYAVQLNGQIAQSLQELCNVTYFKKRRRNGRKAASQFKMEHGAIVSVVQNDWLKGKNEICNAYIKSIRNAKEEIIIVGSYFLPGIRIIRALKKAAENKVQIKLILTGKSDLPLTRRATRFLYGKLLSYKIELYEWDRSILHGKTAVIDGYWTTVGSFNLNNLSSYGSLEMNVVIESSSFSAMYRTQLLEIISQCQPITTEILQNETDLLEKLTNLLSYFITRVVEIIVTYTPYKRFYN